MSKVDNAQVAELMEQLEVLRAENNKLKAKKETALSLKVSQKGACSVYGLGRFPVTLYKKQWKRLIAFVSTIEKFLIENDSLLKDKDENKDK